MVSVLIPLADLGWDPSFSTTVPDDLRPARETCEQCHWPTKFVGERLKVRTHYAEDAANTEMKTALMVKVGGKQAGQSQGIHWHVDPNHHIVRTPSKLGKNRNTI